jgi:hypothetical protein
VDVQRAGAALRALVRQQQRVLERLAVKQAMKQTVTEALGSQARRACQSRRRWHAAKLVGEAGRRADAHWQCPYLHSS